MQIYMQSDREEIEVFLCEDPPDEDVGSSPLHAVSPSKQGKSIEKYKYLFHFKCKLNRISI
jgi:hypothetical protein